MYCLKMAILAVTLHYCRIDFWRKSLLFRQAKSVTVSKNTQRLPEQQQREPNKILPPKNN